MCPSKKTGGHAPVIRPDDSRYFLFLLRTHYAVIGPGESQDRLDRTGRAYTSFFVKRAGRAFSCYTEQQGVIRPHALIICRARFADAFYPVIRNDCVLDVHHGIPLHASVSGTGPGQSLRGRKSRLIINYHGLPDNEIMPCLPVRRSWLEILKKCNERTLYSPWHAGTRPDIIPAADNITINMMDLRKCNQPDSRR